ncbi:MAG: biotin/lipoyl-containing protein, partial [Opitutaceae bacterium]
MPLLDVKIPPMGESITSGVLAKWHVQDGELVKRDQPLFELETDKITSEGTAEAAGRVTLKVAAGSEVKIGQVVATIEVAEAGDRRPPPAAAANPEPKIQKPEPKASTAPASPAVRRLATETGIDPAVVAGRGKGSRVTKADMLSAAEAAKKLETGDRKPEAGGPQTAGAGLEPRTPGPERRTLAPEPVTVPDRPAGAARQTRRKLSPLRQRIAERLVQAQHEAAMLTTFNEVDMSA